MVKDIYITLLYWQQKTSLLLSSGSFSEPPSNNTQAVTVYQLPRLSCKMLSALVDQYLPADGCFIFHQIEYILQFCNGYLLQ
jgi:hypothetical protein